MPQYLPTQCYWYAMEFEDEVPQHFLPGAFQNFILNQAWEYIWDLQWTDMKLIKQSKPLTISLSQFVRVQAIFQCDVVTSAAIAACLLLGAGKNAN